MFFYVNVKNKDLVKILIVTHLQFADFLFIHFHFNFKNIQGEETRQTLKMFIKIDQTSITMRYKQQT